MGTAVHDPELSGAFDDLDAALDRLAAVGVVPVGGRDAYPVVRRLEAAGSRLYGQQVQVLAAIHEHGLFAEDGHRSAKAMVQAAGNVSGAVAGQRAKTGRALRHLPTVQALLGTGRLGRCQVDRIARTFANARVRDRLIAVEADLAVVAERLPYAEFDRYLSEWERLADEDGADRAAERNHANRNFRIHVNIDGSVRVEGGCGGVQGLILKEVFDRYVEDEWHADWTEARATRGDHATVDDLPRTDAQRRMDALSAIFDDAIAQKTGGRHGRGPQLVVDLVIDDITYAGTVQRMTGQPVDPDPRLDDWWHDLAHQLHDHDPADPQSTDPDTADAGPDGRATDEGTKARPGGGADDEPSAGDADGGGDEDRPNPRPGGPGGTEHTGPDRAGPPARPAYRSGSIDGQPLDPREIIAASITGQMRRVVMRADSVVTDLGQRGRLFRDGAQLAVRLSRSSCYRTACGVPTSHTQTDHLIEFNGPKRGPTSPDNGAPACGPHNRHKTTANLTIRRDRWGRFHITRPDGTDIT